MTKEQLDHLRAIGAHLDTLLSKIAAERTPGEWKIKDDLCAKSGYHFVGMGSSPLGTIVTGIEADAAFIATCAGRAEAGWRSTKVAIEVIHCLTELMEYEKKGLAYGLAEIIRKALAEPILAAWPRELLN